MSPRAPGHAPSLFRSFGTVGSYTLLSRISGFARDMLQAAFLGAGEASGAFIVAFKIPNLFRRLFAEGAFSAGFVPIFAALHEGEGHAKAMTFAKEAASVLVLALTAFSVLMIALMPLALQVMAPGFDRTPELMDRTVELARIAFPYLFFVSLVSLQSGILNALHFFAAAAAAPILLNLTIITALLAAVAAGGDRALWMACGVAVAGLIQFAWLAVHCHRAGAALKLGMPRLTPEVKQLLRRMLPVAFGAGIYQLNMLVDTVLATLVSVGAVSWLYYADRVNQLPVGVVGVAIGIVLLPLLARQIRAGNEAAALANQNRAIEVSLLLTVPAAVGIGVLATPIAATLFERGAFSAADREAVAAALMTFALGLPAYVLNKALTPGFFGRHDTATPVKVAMLAFVVNLCVSLPLMRVIGHVGIALATSVAAWLNAGLLAFILRQRGHLVPDLRLKRRLPRLGAAALAMGLVLWVWRDFVMPLMGPVFGAPGVPAGPESLRAGMLAVLVAVGAGVFGAAALLLGAAATDDLKQFRRAS